MKAKAFWAVVIVVIVAFAGWLASCGSSGSSATTATAAMTVHVSDPPVCSTNSGGPYSSVIVTITDVQIHQSGAPGQSGWADLTPGMAPTQVDLLGSAASGGCFLAQLGATTEIQAGTYDQIRIMLASNTASITGNQCPSGDGNNCVEYNGVFYPLNLSSEAQTGIKIPSGQLAGGQIHVAAGSTVDLAIDFDGCASILRQGNGQFRLKPVLHAGEVNLTAQSINGTLVDPTTGKAIPNAVGIVALESQQNVNGVLVDRVVMQTTVNPTTGAFVFCPVPAGSYDIVAVIETGSGASAVAYAAAVTTGVQPGDALGDVPMYVQTAPNAAPGSITGLVTTSTGSAAISEDLTLSALQPMTIGGSAVDVTIPLPQDSSATLSEATGPSTATVTCPTNTDCASYTFALPAIMPYLGAFSAGGTTYAEVALPPAGVGYTVDAQAFLASDGVTPTCSPSNDMMTSLESDNTTALTVTSGTTVTAQTLAFSGCQ